MSYLNIFRREFKKTIVLFEISTLEFSKLRYFEKKFKWLNFGTKMPYLGIFGLEFENNMIIHEISTLEFVYLENFVK